MDVYTVIRASLRRWYVLVPLLVLVGVATAFQARGAAPTYSQSAQLLLTGRATVSDPQGGTYVNPIGGSSTVLAVLVPRLNSNAFISATSVDGAYVTAAAQTKAPVLVLTSQGSSASATSAALGRALADAPQELKKLQSDLSVNAAVTSTLTPNVVDFRPIANYPSRTRSVIITALVGVVLAIVLADLTDVLIRRRSRRVATRSLESVTEDRLAPMPGPAGPPSTVAQPLLATDGPTGPSTAAQVPSYRDTHDKALTTPVVGRRRRRAGGVNVARRS